MSTTNETKNFSSLDELRDARRSYVTQAQQNGFEDGLRTLLADLYPDNAHFIYELLQNAEDAKASTVHFQLFDEQLRFSHNGKRPFELNDVVAITGIGQSTKKDDETQIGKFGVGFKAVFTYTRHPEVHSSDYSFMIRDLFVPEPINSEAVDRETLFVFPFDSEEKSPAISFDEITRGLLELGSSTVLFLNNITTISYETVAGEEGRITRTPTGDRTIEITQTNNESSQRSSWLRLVDHLDGSDGPLSVAAAFALSTADPEAASRSGRMRIEPLDSGDTCIYFPAVKESSGLRFHIHAPFSSTVARDSIRNKPENAELVAAIGNLVASSLPALRDDGFLNDGLLSALPNLDDPLEAPYSVVRDLIYEAFQTEALTPVFRSPEFAPATELVASPVEFRTGLDPSDLLTLLPIIQTWDVEPRWIAPRQGRAGQFLKGLTVQPFGFEELQSLLETIEHELVSRFDEETDSSTSTTWREWIESRTDEQLRSFLELLGHGYLSEDLYYTVVIPLFRVLTEDGVDHVHGGEIYLPADTDDTGPNRIPTALAYFDDDDASTGRSALEAVYKEYRIRRWDEQAMTRDRLKAYTGSPPDNGARHVEDLRLFVRHLKSSPADAFLFRDKKLLWGQDEDGQSHWLRPDELVIDEPYESTGLFEAFDYRLDEYYNGKVAGIADFARALGARSRLEIKRIGPWWNSELDQRWRRPRETHKGPKYDWSLNGLSQVVASGNPEALHQLWELICSEQANKAHGVYQANGGSELHRFTSQVAQQLSTMAWILNRSGELRTPASMTSAELPHGWSEPPANSLAVAVGFGKEERSRSQQQLSRQLHASELGIPLEFVDGFADLDEDGQAEVRAVIEALRHRAEFPADAPADPERRRSIVATDARDAPANEKEMRQRSVATGTARLVKAEAKQYLRAQYTNRNGELMCQACHQPSEFKVDDEWYFEATAFLSKQKYLHHQNHLALCPLCAAKYQYVRGPEDDALLASLVEIEASSETGTVELPIQLNSKRITLKFTGKHSLDLQTALTAVDGTGKTKPS